jgi:hypothetical protein
MTAQQPKVQQPDPTRFQDPQAADISSNQYCSVGSEVGIKKKSEEKNNFLKYYTKFFGGKFFFATRVVFSGKISKL